ncbi:MAG: putative bifunctional diguanylate cyclase/phosphodiesterase [Actinomycetes bacterium]
MRRPSLLVRFAAVSLLLTALLGVVLAHVLSGMVERRGLESATDAAVLATNVGVAPLLDESDVATGVDWLPADVAADLERAVRASSGRTEIARVKIWNRDSRLIFSVDQEGAAAPEQVTSESHELAEALEGVVEAELIASSSESDNGSLLERHGSLLEVYVPIRFEGRDEPAGAFELYLPYGPVQDRIQADALRTTVLLGLGLLVLWLGLFRTVASASRQLRSQAERTAHQALHDPLTGLPNRTLLQDRVGQALRAADRAKAPVALVVLDLDRFQEVNDTLGHEHGDDLIRRVAARLRGTARAADTVARLGGDEFAVLLAGVDGEAGALVAAERLREALRPPFDVGGLQLAVEASMGVAVYPTDAADADALLRHADVAMYVAKRSHSGTVVYDPADDHHSTERLQMLAELRIAIETGELVLRYQPKLNLETGRVTGVEALVRWVHPQRGILGPLEFIPVAERTGLIHSLTDEVLRMAVTQASRWRAEGTPLVVSVNVSTRSLRSVEFPDRVLDLIEEHGLPAELLCLEITETTIMEDPQRALEVLTRLHEAGVRLSIDDFGTGYSSLAYLKRLPLDELKVDRSFVSNLTTNDRDRVIVTSTVALGRSLGLDVVAEGVEDDDTRTALRELGCDLAQGFLWSVPVEPEEVDAWRVVPV